MAEYIPDQAIADYNAQQIDRGEVLIDPQTGNYVPVTFQADRFASKGFIADAAFDAYDLQESDGLTEEEQIHLSYLRNLQQQEQEAEDGSDVSSRFSDDSQAEPEPPLDDSEDPEEGSDDDGDSDDEGEEAEGLLDGLDEELDWSGLDPEDPDTLPSDQDFLDEINALQNASEPDADVGRYWEDLANGFDKEGYEPQAVVADLISQWHLGRVSTQQAIDIAVNRLGKEEAVAAYGSLRLTGFIR
jgi:hypothetical protein